MVKPKILFVTDTPFWHRKGGCQERIYGLVIASCSIGAEPHILYLGACGLSDYRIWSRKRPYKVHTIKNRPRIVTPYARLLVLIKKFFSSWVSTPKWWVRRDAHRSHNYQSIDVKDLHWPSYELAWSKRIQSTVRAQAVVYVYAHMHKIMRLTHQHGVKVLDAHDAMSQRLASFQQSGWDTAGNLLIDASLERLLLNDFDYCIAITNNDRQYFQSIGVTSKIVVCPVATSGQICPTKKLSKQLRLGFLGSSVNHNVIGLQWFIDEVLPKIRERHKVKLVIAGACGYHIKIPEPLKSNVEIWGEIDSPAKFFNVVDVSINPIRAGSGQKVKIATSLAHGVPVFSSTSGLSGYEHLLGSCLFESNEPKDYINLLENWNLDIHAWTKSANSRAVLQHDASQSSKRLMQGFLSHA